MEDWEVAVARVRIVLVVRSAYGFDNFQASKQNQAVAGAC